MQWLEAAGRELQGRVKELWKHEHDLQEQSANTQEEHSVVYEHPGVKTEAISQGSKTKEAEIAYPIDVSAPLVVAQPDVKLLTPSKTLLACTPDQYVEAWEWVGAVELRKLDHTFDETVAECFDDTSIILNASLLALKYGYLQKAMEKFEASLKQLWNQESAMVLWKPTQVKQTTKPRSQQNAADGVVTHTRKTLKVFTQDLSQFDSKIKKVFE